MLDGHDDVGVRPAAADVAAHALANLRRGSGVMFIEQRDRGHDLTWSAVTTLESVLLDVRGLDPVKPILVRQAFDCYDLFPLLHDCEGEAGVDSPPVNQDGAGPTLAAVAALLVPFRPRYSRIASSSVTRGSI